MKSKAHPCGDVRLGALLAEDEASDAYRTAAEHVEHCETCQRRLTTLAADDDWWSDAHTLLSGECEPRWEPDTSQSDIFAESADHAAESVRDTVLGLLGAPGHPEMLGRLGRYDIERVIGSGGMGVVLKAHDSELNRPIAVKLLAPHLAHVGAARERFAREGRAAAAVVQEHVVAIYNVESGGPVPFLVMQYVPGRSLQARVDRGRSAGRGGDSANRHAGGIGARGRASARARASRREALEHFAGESGRARRADRLRTCACD